MQYSDISHAVSPSLITLTMALLELIASLPPFKITVLPDLKQSENASSVTFGLDSYIIPITPIGTLFLPILRPFGLSHMEITSPTGSSSAATCLTPSAIPLILSGVSLSLSRRLSFIPADLPVSISFLFSSMI